MQRSAVQHRTVQCSAVQCSAVQRSAVQCGARGALPGAMTPSTSLAMARLPCSAPSGARGTLPRHCPMAGPEKRCPGLGSGHSAVQRSLVPCSAVQCRARGAPTWCHDHGLHVEAALLGPEHGEGPPLQVLLDGGTHLARQRDRHKAAEGVALLLLKQEVEHPIRSLACRCWAARPATKASAPELCRQCSPMQCSAVRCSAVQYTMCSAHAVRPAGGGGDWR